MSDSNKPDCLLPQRNAANFEARYRGLKPYILVALGQLVQGGFTREAAERAYQDYQAFSTGNDDKLSEGGEAFKTALRNILRTRGYGNEET
jgi:hypothetical protein